jgi:hypothetical protein
VVGVAVKVAGMLAAVVGMAATVVGVVAASANYGIVTTSSEEEEESYGESDDRLNVSARSSPHLTNSLSVLLSYPSSPISTRPPWLLISPILRSSRIWVFFGRSQMLRLPQDSWDVASSCFTRSSY